MILQALQYATKKHEGQVRKVSEEPYITHPIKVSYLLASYKTSHKFDYLIVASLLHDVVEDTDASYEEILQNFGPLVTSLVFELTNDAEEMKRLGSKLEYQKRKLLGMSSWALTIKLVDRLANITDHPSEKMVADTLELLTFLEENRKLSSTQSKIVTDIRNFIMH